ncbi:MAG: hypothetical protein CME65_08635 [Halobacteriovoraceae bacterium]|nr:hypothetical protein [Halobacteriovoraceae bacterium]|tara:strand:+ start:5022 stop:5498 length:477 start_codon:yes stop_codon:yes gene_type:complete
MKWISLFTILFSFQAFAARNIAEYNLGAGQTGLVHHVTGDAYDPVSIFPEGGSSIAKGKSEISLTHEGVTYHFASENNRELFKADPKKYEPTYGGWCARAMIVGQRIGIDPKYYTISGRRAHYFVNSRAKRFFDRDVTRYEGEADQAWEQQSGEEPRL